MLAPFPFAACTSHPQILQCPSKSREFMTREMSHADHNRRHMDITGDGDCFEKGFVNPYVDGTISPKAIGNEDGGIDDRIGKPMLIGSGQMGNGLLPHPSGGGVRIC